MRSLGTASIAIDTSGSTGEPVPEYDIEKFFEMSVDLLGIADTECCFRRVNRAFERVLGWPTADLLCRPFLDLVHPEDLEVTVREIARLASGVPTISFENRYRCADGTYRHLLWTAFRDGTHQLLYAVARDTTATHQRDALTRRLVNAVEQTADTVIITDRTGAIEYVNPAFERTTGYTAEEVTGSTPRILKSGVHPPEFYRRLWGNLVAGQVVRGVVTNRKKNHTLYDAEQTITPMTNPQGVVTHFVSVVRDITERRRREGQDAELRLAASIQRRLYPDKMPLVAGFDLAALTVPAGAMNGDYFDFVTLQDGSIGIAVGDVSGHGLGQALVMVETRAFLRSVAREHTDVGQILTSLDRLLASDLAPDSFVSLLLVRIDPRSRTFQYASAGHETGYLLDRSGAVKMPLTSTGFPLGLPAEIAPGRVVMTSSPMRFERGDVLALLTDGIVDAESPAGAPFGRQRVVEAIGVHGGTSAQGMADDLRGAVESFLEGAPQRDDITAIICRCESC